MEWEIVNLDMTFKVDAPVEEVFRAWTKPSLFKQWFMTTEETNKVAKNQFEINGDWKLSMSERALNIEQLARI
ncbi:SRPBCC domain-containing protein [Staphylococcus saprophyticus]|nr:SRPBCC domain-containing protein [Staphylococcus saprophyticus]